MLSFLHFQEHKITPKISKPLTDTFINNPQNHKITDELIVNEVAILIVTPEARPSSQHKSVNVNKYQINTKTVEVHYGQ